MTTVLITGANRGLGLEFCRQYAESGWRVLAGCREPETAGALRGLADSYPQLSLHRLDLGQFGQIDALAQELADQPIDVLLSNAGVYGDSAQTGFGKLDYAAWRRVLDINLLAPVKLAEAFQPQLGLGSRKLIVALTSLMGSIADNTSGGSILYRSSKAALNAAMKSLSLELRPQGVGVLLLHPGWVKTDMGGPDAPTLPEASVAGMRRVIESYGPGDSGRFLDFQGRPLPW
ncbi:NAD(P)-dependent dehydrogenase, short-chain alcohol dehydrogenase family [Methylomagnum ishizawai]|uniref:NAD(P)-dependent dehydrogenase, short-chain alcohol dehydrogenase family n=1 Tax=Methylomagnum ishizawai TaxID=1760988 RepID=A0A1Y6CUP9_9GAMM|nr:SDR family oxidoreductase [Methylomagnum ishizawai]SMF94037.1 NAD(P)-dependent dehydrogenase, short-chain alcohol dehydrogenase family [Methylomagnum ishizawai]